MALSMMKKYEIAMKHAKKFAVKPSSLREELKGVYHNPNGSVEITDSYKLLRIKGAHSLSEPKLINVKTGAEMDCGYPNVEKIIPTEFILTFDIYGSHLVKNVFEHIKLAYNVAKYADKNDPLAYLQVSDDVNIIVDQETIYYSAVLQTDTGLDHGLKWGVNAEHLYDAINVFKDAGTEYLSFKFSDKLSPLKVILMSDEENGIDIVILSREAK